MAAFWDLQVSVSVATRRTCKLRGELGQKCQLHEAAAGRSVGCSFQVGNKNAHWQWQIYFQALQAGTLVSKRVGLHIGGTTLSSVELNLDQFKPAAEMRLAQPQLSPATAHA